MKLDKLSATDLACELILYLHVLILNELDLGSALLIPCWDGCLSAIDHSHS